MTPPFTLTNQQARLLFLERQELSRSPTPKLSDEGLADLIKALGFIQVDSINTVARAHHMILFSRNQTYRPDQLKRLLETDRRLFEHWTHDAAIIPIEFHPYWQHRFLRDEVMLRARWKSGRRQGFEEALLEIEDRVRKRGPTLTRDIKTKSPKKSGGWWDWHPEKAALEFHWRTGKLSISGRDKFQKIYDLAENVIPTRYRHTKVSEPEFIEWACHSALTRLGVATSGEIAAFWDLITPKEAAEWVLNQKASGHIIEVQIGSADGTPARKSLAFSDLPDKLENLPTPPKRVRVLSPFDPLIRDRKRCLRLFGFDYRIEVFVPAPKRQYGYYVFPLLEGTKLIGRIDMKGENGILNVTGLWMEPGVRLGQDRKTSITAELERYRRFIGAEDMRISPGCGL